MVKVKIEKSKAIIIDDAESTPGQSRQFDLFEAQVLPILSKENWEDELKKLDTRFELSEKRITDSGVIAIFEMR